MIVMVQHRGGNRVPMSCRPRALLNDLVGHQVGRNTATEGGDLGLDHLSLMSERVLVLDNPVGLGRFRVGLQAVSDVQADGLVRLGRQTIMSRLVGRQVIVGRGDVGQQKILIGHPSQGLGLDDFTMLGIVHQLNVNRLRLGVVDDRDRDWTGRRGGRLGGNSCDRWLITRSGWYLILRPLGIAIHLPVTIGDGPGAQVLGRRPVELHGLVDGLRHLGVGINHANRAGDLGVGTGISRRDVLGLWLLGLIGRGGFDRLVFDCCGSGMIVRVVPRSGIIDRKDGVTLPPVVLGKDLIKGVKPVGHDSVIAAGVGRRGVVPWTGRGFGVGWNPQFTKEDRLVPLVVQGLDLLDNVLVAVVIRDIIEGFLQVCRRRVGFVGQLEVSGDTDDIDVLPKLAVEHIVVVGDGVGCPVGVVPPVGTEKELTMVERTDLVNGGFPIVFILFGVDQVGRQIHAVNMMFFGKASGAFQQLVIVGKEAVLVGRGPGGFDIAQVIDNRVELDDNLVALGLQGGDVGGHLVPVGLADRRLVPVKIPKVS